MAIIQHRNWKQAMINITHDENTQAFDTPMRKMIRKMPEVAKVVLDKGISKNEEDNMFTFDFSFIDDSDKFNKPITESTKSDDTTSGSKNNDVSVSRKDDKKQNKKGSHVKTNHPLTLMVKHKRSNLIAHPLVTSLIRHKWNHYGRYFYYTGLFIYALFVAFLTGYVLTTPPPYYLYQDNGTLVWKANGEEKYGQEANSYVQPTFTAICKWAVIGLAIFSILKEMIQMGIHSLEYVNTENIMELVTFTLSILLVANFNGEQERSGLRYVMYQTFMF
ncbi:transient receptor potential cation channel subfamily A member 1 homolog [Glandiceps talaboti]